ncbi:hypothetical protein Tco_1038997 [Tanacetum coccineum]
MNKQSKSTIVEGGDQTTKTHWLDGSGVKKPTGYGGRVRHVPADRPGSSSTAATSKFPWTNMRSTARAWAWVQWAEYIGNDGGRDGVYGEYSSSDVYATLSSFAYCSMLFVSQLCFGSEEAQHRLFKKERKHSTSLAKSGTARLLVPKKLHLKVQNQYSEQKGS